MFLKAEMEIIFVLEILNLLKLLKLVQQDIKLLTQHQLLLKQN